MIAMLTLAAMLVTPTAQAQEFQVRNGVILQALPGSYYANGVGAPSVTYDPNRGRWFMAFETRLATTDPACPNGMWGIGAAISTDGINWTVKSTPIVSPTAGTWYSCVAAHPTIRYVPSRDLIYVWYKGEQRSDVCDNSAAAPAWGCNRFTGVGLGAFYAASGNPFGVAAAPDITGQNIGFPKQVRVGNTYVMTYEKYPDIYVAKGNNPLDLVPELNPVMTPDPVNVPWASDEYFNPAITCTSDPANRYVSYLGGRDLTQFVIDFGGIGRAESADALSWNISSAADFTWVGDDAFRHWDVLRVNTDDYIMYFSERDSLGNPRIRFASTLTPNNPPTTLSTVNNKQCQ